MTLFVLQQAWNQVTKYGNYMQPKKQFHMQSTNVTKVMRVLAFSLFIFSTQCSPALGLGTRREMKYTSQNCSAKTMDDKMALYRECCFPNCTKLW